jgi:hypothetical protein
MKPTQTTTTIFFITYPHLLATIDEIIRSTSTYPVHSDKIAFISILERSGKARS